MNTTALVILLFVIGLPLLAITIMCYLPSEVATKVEKWLIGLTKKSK